VVHKLGNKPGVFVEDRAKVAFEPSASLEGAVPPESQEAERSQPRAIVSFRVQVGVHGRRVAVLFLRSSRMNLGTVSRGANGGGWDGGGWDGGGWDDAVSTTLRRLCRTCAALTRHATLVLSTHVRGALQASCWVAGLGHVRAKLDGHWTRPTSVGQIAIVDVDVPPGERAVECEMLPTADNRSGFRIMSVFTF